MVKKWFNLSYEQITWTETRHITVCTAYGGKKALQVTDFWGQQGHGVMCVRNTNRLHSNKRTEMKTSRLNYTNKGPYESALSSAPAWYTYTTRQYTYTDRQYTYSTLRTRSLCQTASHVIQSVLKKGGGVGSMWLAWWEAHSLHGLEVRGSLHFTFGSLKALLTKNTSKWITQLRICSIKALQFQQLINRWGICECGMFYMQ